MTTPRDPKGNSKKKQRPLGMLALLAVCLLELGTNRPDASERYRLLLAFWPALLAPLQLL